MDGTVPKSASTYLRNEMEKRKTGKSIHCRMAAKKKKKSEQTTISPFSMPPQRSFRLSSPASSHPTNNP